MVSKFNNGIHESKGHENEIKTIVKSRETFYRHHTVLVPVTSCSEAIYVFNILTLILKQKASWVLESTRYILCIKRELCTVLSAIYILTGFNTNSKVWTNLSALKLPAIQLLSKFGKSLSSPIPFKMRSYAKLSNNLLKYSKPTYHVLLWMILGIKYTTEVKLVISIPFRLPVLIYICIFWGTCIQPIYRRIVFKT